MCHAAAAGVAIAQIIASASSQYAINRNYNKFEWGLILGGKAGHLSAELRLLLTLTGSDPKSTAKPWQPAVGGAVAVGAAAFAWELLLFT